MPGNIALDPSGKELTPQRHVVAIVYFETESKDIIFENAIINGSIFKITTEPVLQFPFDAGISYKTNEKILVSAQKNGFLWKLTIEPIILKDGNDLQSDTLFIQGKYKKKPFQQRIYKWEKIEPIPTY
jgi:hypothetical protein